MLFFFYIEFHLPFSNKVLLAASARCCRNVFAMLSLQLHGGCVCYVHKFCYVNRPSIFPVCAGKYFIFYRIPRIYSRLGFFPPFISQLMFSLKGWVFSLHFLQFWAPLNSLAMIPNSLDKARSYFLWSSEEFWGRIQQKWQWVTYSSQPFVTSVGSCVFQRMSYFSETLCGAAQPFCCIFLGTCLFLYCRNSFKECWVASVKDFNAVPSLQCFVKWLEHLLPSILTDQILVDLFHY